MQELSEHADGLFYEVENILNERVSLIKEDLISKITELTTNIDYQSIANKTYPYLKNRVSTQIGNELRCYINSNRSEFTKLFNEIFDEELKKQLRSELKSFIQKECKKFAEEFFREKFGG